jgi:hypothetical protein
MGEFQPKENNLSNFLNTQKRAMLTKLKEQLANTSNPDRQRTLQNMIEKLEAEINNSGNSNGK